MRFLFMNIFGTGHVGPSLSLVKHLTGAGSEVVYFTHQKFKNKLEQCGGKFKSYGDNFTVMNYTAEGNVLPTALFPGAVFGMLPIVLDFIEKDEMENGNFDAIIFDTFAFGGYFISRILNKPAIRSSSSFPGAYVESFKRYYLPDSDETKKAMECLESKYSLVKNKDFYIPHEDCLQHNADDVLSVVYTLECLQPSVEDLNHGKFVYTGHGILPELHEELDEKDKDIIKSISTWKDNGYNVLYFSMGTVIPLEVSHLKALSTALSKIGKFKALVSGCNDKLKNELQELEEPIDLSNIELQNFVPQLEVLSKTDVFLSHCGMNSVTEAIFKGVPIIGVPAHEEQSFNANTAKDAGMAIVLDKDNLTSSAIEEALSTIQSGNYHSKAKELSKQMNEANQWPNVIQTIFNFVNNKITKDQ